MELSELRVFLTVASERSFSKAAMKLHRTQPAISQSVRRLEDSVGERLFDRATKDATLTEAGRLLRDYADRLLRLSEEAEEAVKDLRDLRRGRVLIGCNEASVHAVLPLIERFRSGHPLVHVDVRRIPARQLGAEVAQGTLDFGVLTFQPAEAQLGSIVLGWDGTDIDPSDADLDVPADPVAGVTASVPALMMAPAASTAVAKYGAQSSARPISSSTMP